MTTATTATTATTTTTPSPLTREQRAAKMARAGMSDADIESILGPATPAAPVEPPCPAANDILGLAGYRTAEQAKQEAKLRAEADAAFAKLTPAAQAQSRLASALLDAHAELALDMSTVGCDEDNIQGAMWDRYSGCSAAARIAALSNNESVRTRGAAAAAAAETALTCGNEATWLGSMIGNIPVVGHGYRAVAQAFMPNASSRARTTANLVLANAGFAAGRTAR